MENRLNNENYELYIFKYKEGTLDAEEAAMVEEALRQNPQWQELADLYDPSLTLPTDTTLHFQGKEALMNNGTTDGAEYRTPVISLQKKRRLRFPIWTAAAAAACIALLFVISSLRSIKQQRESGPLSANTQIKLEDLPIIMESTVKPTQPTAKTAVFQRQEKGLPNTGITEPVHTNDYLVQATETAADSGAATVEEPRQETMESNTYTTTYSDRLIVFVYDTTNGSDQSDLTESEAVLATAEQDARKASGTKMEEAIIILRIRTTRLRTNTLTFINHATITTTAMLADTRQSMENRVKSIIKK